MRSTWPKPPSYYLEPSKLEPPLPPSEKEEIVAFGQVIDLTKNTLSILDRLKKYNATGIELPPLSDFCSSETTKEQLKKLNHSLLFNFLELLNILVETPELALWKLGQIRDVIINLFMMLNQYRPFQVSCLRPGVLVS